MEFKETIQTKKCSAPYALLIPCTSRHACASVCVCVCLCGFWKNRKEKNTFVFILAYLIYCINRSTHSNSLPCAGKPLTMNMNMTTLLWFYFINNFLVKAIPFSQRLVAFGFDCYCKFHSFFSWCPSSSATLGMKFNSFCLLTKQLMFALQRMRYRYQIIGIKSFNVKIDNWIRIYYCTVWWGARKFNFIFCNTACVLRWWLV